jgi:two-component system, response regulator RegA
MGDIRNVLLVDDEETLLSACRRTLGRERKVFTANNPVAALEVSAHQPLDLAIIDLRLGETSGIELVEELRRSSPNIVIAMYSAYLSVVAAVAAVRAGADRVFTKPISFTEIVRRVETNEPDPEPDLEETPTLAQVEWEHIMRVLEDCGGNVSMAARVLGIYRSSLQRKLRKHAPRD